MLHTQGTSREKGEDHPRIIAQANGPERCHLIFPVTASLTRPDGTNELRLRWSRNRFWRGRHDSLPGARCGEFPDGTLYPITRAIGLH